MKIIKLLLVSFSLLLLQQTQACGGWYYSDYYNIYRIDQMLPNGTLGLTYHNNKTEFVGNAVEDNLKEWEFFFGGKYTQKELANLIYTKETLYNLDSATKTLNKSMHFEVSAFNNYMSFAKECELISNADNDPWNYEKNEIDYNKINQLIKIATTNIKNSKNPFYKERYTFQLLKLLYYEKQYDKTIKTYDTFYTNNTTSSVLKYWALNYKAGAQMKINQTAEANYNFLKSFHYYAGNRHKSYYSMSFSDETQFNKVLELCQNNEEKAAFYFIRGVNRKSVVLEDLKQVLQLAPNSEYAEILMANEIVKMEHSYWEVDSKYQDNEWVEDVKKVSNNQLMKYIQEFIPIVKNNSEKLKNKTFWNITLAYLHTLNKSYQKSENILANINTKVENYQNQIEAIKLLNYIFLHPTLSTKNENELGKLWFAYNNGAALSYDNIYSYDKQLRSTNHLCMNLLHKYYKDKNDLKALLFSGVNLDYYKDEYTEKMELETIQSLRKQLKSSTKTTLLEYGIKIFLNEETNQNNLDNALKEIEATLYMRNPNTLQKAITLFSELPNATPIKTNPFNMEIKDCIWGSWGENESCNHKPSNYTKLTLAQKLLEIKNIAESKNSAMDYYLLGNAYYNMTYYGHAWETLSYFRSGSSNTGFTDCSIALNFYEKAIDLIEGNKEMQAKATFMAAKCEQNLYFDAVYEKDKWANPIEYNWENKKESIINYNNQAEAAGYRKHFKKLEQDYKDTKYYQEIIRECSYFDIYVSQ